MRPNYPNQQALINYLFHFAIFFLINHLYRYCNFNVSWSRLKVFTWLKFVFIAVAEMLSSYSVDQYNQQTNCSDPRLRSNQVRPSSIIIIIIIITRLMTHVKVIHRVKNRWCGWSRISEGKLGCKVQSLPVVWKLQGRRGLRLCLVVNCSRLLVWCGKARSAKARLVRSSCSRFLPQDRSWHEAARNPMMLAR